MDPLLLARVTARTATEVCERFPLGASARAFLREGQTPGEYLALLIERKEYPDAIRFLAHALPKREAVWWACLCARSAGGGEVPEPQLAAIRAAEAWVCDPSEERRREALPAAEASRFSTPAGCAAAAAFWSGGSLGPPNVPAIPPGESLTAHGVAGAVMLAAVTSEPEQTAGRYRRFLDRGVEVADGEHPWPEPSPAAPAGQVETANPAPAPSKATRPNLNWD